MTEERREFEKLKARAADISRRGTHNKSRPRVLCLPVDGKMESYVGLVPGLGMAIAADNAYGFEVVTRIDWMAELVTLSPRNPPITIDEFMRLMQREPTAAQQVTR
jgi:hypothetical protein